MKSLNAIRMIILSAIFFLSGCIEPYTPPVDAPPDSYLVVNGSVGNSDGYITLTRTQAVDDNSPAAPESGAQISVITEAGQTFLFSSEVEGTYRASGMNLTISDRCKLRIRLTSGKEYESDFVLVKETPPIDSITWKADAEGLTIFVNTHDQSNNTQYYLWDYEETGQYTSPLRSYYVWDPDSDSVVPRTEETDIYNCWRTDVSDKILLGTSVQLDQDIIREYPITSVPASSWKHGLKYSIRVRQHALTEDAFEYLQNLKKTTEEIGSLFGPLPANVEGNIRCITNPGEPVVGFFSVSTVAEKRIFISVAELPDEWFTIRARGFQAECIFDPVDTVLLLQLNNAPTNYLLLNEIREESLIGYSTHERNCIDCRLFNGGTNVKPEFWE